MIAHFAVNHSLLNALPRLPACSVFALEGVRRADHDPQVLKPRSSSRWAAAAAAAAAASKWRAIPCAAPRQSSSGMRRQQHSISQQATSQAAAELHQRWRQQQLVAPLDAAPGAWRRQLSAAESGNVVGQLGGRASDWLQTAQCWALRLARRPGRRCGGAQGAALGAVRVRSETPSVFFEYSLPPICRVAPELPAASLPLIQSTEVLHMAGLSNGLYVNANGRASGRLAMLTRGARCARMPTSTAFRAALTHTAHGAAAHAPAQLLADLATGGGAVRRC